MTTNEKHIMTYIPADYYAWWLFENVGGEFELGWVR